MDYYIIGSTLTNPLYFYLWHYHHYRIFSTPSPITISSNQQPLSMYLMKPFKKALGKKIRFKSDKKPVHQVLYQPS